MASDAPRSERLASVTSDAHASGAIAAELFSRTVHKTGYLATITGDLTTLDHAEKLRGFAANLAVFAPHLSLLPAIESHEQPKVAYRQANTLLSRKPYPLGVYISTANSVPVLRALEEKNLLGEVQLIATDLFRELVPYIEFGKILATLYQRSFAQGKTALDRSSNDAPGDQGRCRLRDRFGSDRHRLRSRGICKQPDSSGSIGCECYQTFKIY